MRYLFFFLLSLLWAQEGLLKRVDSLMSREDYHAALREYDSVLRVAALAPTQRVQGEAARLLALTKVGKAQQLDTLLPQVEALLQEVPDTYAQGILWFVKAQVFSDSAQHDSALFYITQAKPFLKNSPYYPLLLFAEAQALRGSGALDQAERAYLQARQVYEATGGDTTRRSYVLLLQSLANLYHEQYRYHEALPLYLTAYQALKRHGITSPSIYEAVVGEMTLVQFRLGDYKAAETGFLHLDSVLQKAYGTQHPKYLSNLNRLATTYLSTGRYEEGERLLLYILQTAEQLGEKGFRNKMEAMANLQIAYSFQKRFDEAEKILLQLLSLIPKDHPHYYLILGNLAALYMETENYEKAEPILQEVIQADYERGDTLSPHFIVDVSNLALLHEHQKRYAIAESLYLRCLDLLALVQDTLHQEYARILNNLSNLYYDRRQCDKGIQMARRSLSITHAISEGRMNDRYLDDLYALTNLTACQGDSLVADSLWSILIREMFSFIRHRFPYLPIQHQQQWVSWYVHKRMDAFQIYVARRPLPPLVEAGYRAARSVKGLLLLSAESMRRFVHEQKDTTLTALYEQWRQLIEASVALYLQEAYAEADSIEQIATEVEKQLLKKAPILQDYLPDPAGEPLAPRFPSRTALIEVARVQASADSVLYLFYILTRQKGKTVLRLHTLQVDTTWEQRTLRLYETYRSYGSVITTLPYQMVWRFVDSLLPKNIQQLYFSPDGVYYRINPATLYDGKGFIIDRYRVQYVASTRRLLRRPRKKRASHPPVVVGNPNFQGEATEIPKATGVRSTRFFTVSIPQLPGAELEAQEIARLLGVSPVVGSSATESFIKSLQSPEILHIATHGYFLEKASHPLLSGGLLLAGAALWDSLYPPPGAEDGRLTAREASLLHLQQTRLVTLSACETGLGVVIGDGLYGLWRAFLEAGADRVIATLWMIDDEATRAFMTDFYRIWKKSPQKPPDKAFYTALESFRRAYSHPYYWGAFIVIE